MRPKAMLLVAAVATLPACVHLSASETLRTLTRQVPAANAASIRLDFPVGDVDVVAADQPRIDVDVRIQCDHPSGRCADAARDVEIDVRGESRLRVGLTGWPHSNSRGMKVRATVRVPRDTPLAAKLGVGRLTVTGVGAGLDAGVGVGDVEVTLPEASVATVRAKSGIGGATLRTSEGRRRGRGFLGGSVSWDQGIGKSDVRVNCGVGHAQVVLQ